MNNKINVTVPTSWLELNSDQLEYALRLLAEGFSGDRFLSLCLCRFGGIAVLHSFPNGTFIGSVAGSRFLFTAQDLTPHLKVLDFLNQLPQAPVRLDSLTIGGKQYNAPDTYFNGVPFSIYLAADNYLTGFITTKKPEILTDLCALLYSVPDEYKNKIEDWQRLNSLYFIVGLKKYFQRRFSFLFSDGTTTDRVDDIFATLTETTNAQIRALTGGDILKEEAIMQSDTVRALTELNYKVKELKEIEQRAKER